MAKIMNIGVLNVADIKEELAREITELKNIGLLVESDNSQVFLKNSKRIGIGSTVKLPSDVKVDVILKNGLIEIDQDFLEGLAYPIALLVNGKVIFQNNIDAKLLNDKLYKLVLNGLLVCPSNLKGIIEPRSVINGNTECYKSNYKYIGENIRINNRFLKGLGPDSKLAFSKLMIIDKIDLELFEKKIDKIQVLDKLIISENNEDILSSIEDSYKINTVFIPNGENDVRYFDKDMIIDDNSINSYNKDTIYVEGDVEFYLSKNIRFSDYISHLICDTVICDEQVYNSIKDNLSEDVKVQLIKGKLVKNTSKMEISSELVEEVTIKNMGKLIINEDINVENFEKNVASILNYGVVEAAKDILGLVESKVSENAGRVRELKEPGEVKNEEDDKDVLYANIGELKL